MKRVIGCMIAGFFFLPQAQAQINMKEIVVQDNRVSDRHLSELNENKRVITREEFQDWSVRNLSDVLQYVLGIQSNRRGTGNAQTDLKVNGGTFEQTLILLNGHPVLDPQTGHHFMNLPISVFDIEQIEVVTGPQAFRNGNNGISGTINIITKKARGKEIAINTTAGSSFRQDSATGQAYGGMQWHAGWQHAGKTGRQYAALSSDAGNGFMHNTGFKNLKALYTNDFNIGDHRFALLASYIHNEFGAHGFYAYPYDKESVETVGTMMAALRHEKNLGTHFYIKSNASLRFNSDEYIFKRQDPAYYRNRHKTQSYLGNSNLGYRYKRGELAMGLAYNLQAIQSTNLDSFQRHMVGFFLENVYRFTSKFSASAGLYAHYSSRFGLALLPGLDLGYQVHPSLKIYLSAGSANRVPSYTDLYYKGPSNIGNEFLQPEKALGLDAGARYAGTSLSASLNVFHRRVSNLIDWTKPEQGMVWQPSNFGLQQVSGLQLTAHYAPPKKSSGFIRNIGMQYQYNDISVANQAGNVVSRYTLDYFKHQFLANLTVQTGGGFYWTNTMRYQQRFNINEYILLDTRAGYAAKNWHLYIDVNNVLNTSYTESNALPMPSRWLTLGLSRRLSLTKK